MARILKFARPSVSMAATAETDISQMMTSVFEAQQAARGGIAVALFKMELTLIRCRGAIERIPDDHPEKQKFECHLSAIEHAMMVAKAVAARF
jgi:hypothetical protein